VKVAENYQVKMPEQQPAPQGLPPGFGQEQPAPVQPAPETKAQPKKPEAKPQKK
jgi:hypothetical protein